MYTTWTRSSDGYTTILGYIQDRDSGRVMLQIRWKYMHLSEIFVHALDYTLCFACVPVWRDNIYQVDKRLARWATTSDLRRYRYLHAVISL